MKKIAAFLLLLCFPLLSMAQENCEYTLLTTDGGVEVKSTKEYLMYEKSFANTSTLVFFSLSNHDGIPVLNFQMLSKSKEFTKIQCLDKNSRIYLQLTNGRIITLISLAEDQCSNLIFDEEQKTYIRVLTGAFVFVKDSFDALEKNPISLMRIKYATEVADYNIKKELVSETNNNSYFPESYFLNYLKCIL